MKFPGPTRQVKRIPANDMGAQRTLDRVIVRNRSLITAGNELIAPLLQICNRTRKTAGSRPCI